jgi:uncharacterized membrane protein YqjE
MEESTVSLQQFAGASKDVARQLLSIGENRIELLTLELQEERDRLVQSFLLAVGTAVCALLALLTLTAGLVVLFWPTSPALVLFVLTALYALAGTWFAQRLHDRLQNWHSLAASRDQLQKDRLALRQALS